MEDVIHTVASSFQNSNFSAMVSGVGMAANPAPEELEAEQDAMRYEKELAQMLETEFDDDDILCDIGEDESDCTAAAVAAATAKATTTTTVCTADGFHLSAIGNGNIGTTIDASVVKRLDGCNGHLFENKPNETETRANEMDNNDGRINANNVDNRWKYTNVLSSPSPSKNYRTFPTCSTCSTCSTCPPRTMAEFEQLKVQYDVRMREIENLRSEKSELREGLNRAKLETQQAIVSRNEIQKMLVEATGRTTDTEKELSISRQKCYTLEQINKNTLHELEMCKSTMRELEQRLSVAEKFAAHKSREKNFDNVVKNLTSEHARQLSSLQNELNISNNKLESKQSHLVELQQQLHDLRALHESTLNENHKLKGEFEKLSSRFDERLSPCSSNRATTKFEEQLRNAATNIKEKQTEIRLLEEKLFASSKLVKSLKNAETKYLLEIESLKKENEKLMGELKECEHERETFKIGLTEYAAKTDILHREQMSALELAFSKRVVQLQTEIATCEQRVNEAASKIFAEEIDRITNVYSDHFDKMSRSIQNLKIQFADQPTRSEQASACATATATAADKLRTQIEKIYQKYTNARKIALQLKQLIEDRDRAAKQQREQYVQTLNEIQRYLDNALTNAGVVSTVAMPSMVAATASATACDAAVAPHHLDTIKLAELIEKSKNTVRLDEPSVINNDRLLNDLTRRLSNLEK